MHAVVVTVSIEDQSDEDARRGLEEQVVPRAKESPGFQRGVWLRHEGGDRGTSVLAFDTEENARQTAERLTSDGTPLPGVTIQSVDVYRVMAEA